MKAGKKQAVLIIIVYGAILFGFVVPEALEQGGSYWSRVWTTVPQSGATLLWLLTSASGLAISHGISYYSNFLAKGEYLSTSPARQSLMLGDRLIAMHVFLVLGSVILGLGNLGVYGAVIGISLVKLIGDLAGHSQEHIISQAVGLGNAMSNTRFGAGTIRFFVGGRKKL